MLPKQVRDSLNHSIPEHALHPGYALGGMALGVFALLFFSGLLLAYFGYDPSLSGAYKSVETISATYGLSHLRTIHSVAAELFLFLLALHVTRIVLTKSYLGPRKLTWNLGIALIVIACVFFFTGALLKWDQEGYEAYSHLLWANSFLPLGDQINELLFKGDIPLRMFIVHAVLLPVILTALVCAHMGLVKLLKISNLKPEDSQAPETAKFSSHIEVVFIFTIGIWIAVFMSTYLYLPHLTGEAYAGVEWTKPPWPFLFLYTLENWFGVWPLLFAPPVLIAWLGLIPFFSKPINKIDPGQIIFFAGVIVISILILIGAWSPTVEHMM